VGGRRHGTSLIGQNPKKRLRPRRLRELSKDPIFHKKNHKKGEKSFLRLGRKTRGKTQCFGGRRRDSEVPMGGREGVDKY